MLKVKSFEQSQTGIWVMSKHEIMDLLDQPFANQGCPPAEYTFINHEDMVMLRSIQKGKLPIDDVTWVNGYWKGPERETMHPTRNIDIVNGGA